MRTSHAALARELRLRLAPGAPDGRPTAALVTLDPCTAGVALDAARPAAAPERPACGRPLCSAHCFIAAAAAQGVVLARGRLRRYKPERIVAERVVDARALELPELCDDDDDVVVAHFVLAAPGSGGAEGG